MRWQEKEVKRHPVVIVLVVGIVSGVTVVVGEGVEEGFERANGFLVTLQGSDNEGDVTRRIRRGVGE